MCTLKVLIECVALIISKPFFTYIDVYVGRHIRCSCRAIVEAALVFFLIDFCRVNHMVAEECNGIQVLA